MYENPRGPQLLHPAADALGGVNYFCDDWYYCRLHSFMQFHCPSLIPFVITVKLSL